MAYIVLVTAGIGASAVLIELVLRARRAPGRWTWIAALVLSVAATALVMFVPRPVAETGLAKPATELLNFPLAAGDVGGIGSGARNAALDVTDRVLPPVWACASALLLFAIAFGRKRLARERRRSEAARLNGHDVLVTESLGPAVAGVSNPVVFVPRWVLALDDASQRLLLAHEAEHVKHRDTVLLLGGAVVAALLPWNPAVWWMVRRLRLAVEQDCDARVLAVYPGARRYADLLLMAASRHGVRASLLAAHFGEHTSDLARRIEAMAHTGTISWRRLAVALVVATGLVVAACEAPRPDPVAPGAPRPTVVDASAPLFEYQVEKPVSLAEGSPTPSYPQILRQAGVEGNALVSFVVNEDGEADATSLKVIRSTHALFGEAVRNALPTMRFVPAEVGGRKVKQLVQQPFTFSLPGSGAGASATEREVRKAPLVVLRNQNTLRETPNYVLLSSKGQEVARFAANGLMAEVKTDDIFSIEVFKGPNACQALAKAPCPLIQITLKPGRESAYKK